jgi:hypothetical protein
MQKIISNIRSVNHRKGLFLQPAIQKIPVYNFIAIIVFNFL